MKDALLCHQLQVYQETLEDGDRRKKRPLPSRISYVIPEEFTCLPNGERFLLYDSCVEDEN